MPALAVLSRAGILHLSHIHEAATGHKDTCCTDDDEHAGGDLGHLGALRHDVLDGVEDQAAGDDGQHIGDDDGDCVGDVAVQGVWRDEEQDHRHEQEPDGRIVGAAGVLIELDLLLGRLRHSVGLGALWTVFRSFFLPGAGFFYCHVTLPFY